jgi:hypothetical protein
MAKNDKTTKVAPAKPTSADTKKSSKGSALNRQKEASYIKKNGYNAEMRTKVQHSAAHQCVKCQSTFTCDSAFNIHKKSCGVCTNASCAEFDYESTLTKAQLADVRGNKYARLKHFEEWKPKFDVRRLMTLIVDEKTVLVNAVTRETKQVYTRERQYVTKQKYNSFEDLLYGEPYFNADINDGEDNANVVRGRRDRSDHDDNYEGYDMELDE